MHSGILKKVRGEIRANTLADEAVALKRLVGLADLSAEQRVAISAKAVDLVRTVRSRSNPQILEEPLAKL